MRISQLSVRNFRKFDELILELHPRFTALVGNTGSGKTSVLDALRIGAGAYLLGVPDMKAPSIRREHVRWESRTNGESATLEPVTPSMVRCEGNVHQTELCWHRELTSLEGQTTRTGAQSLRKCIDGQIRKSEPNTTHPLILSYATGRLGARPRMAKRTAPTIRSPLGKLSRFDAYRGCLEPTTSSEFMRGWIKKMALIDARRDRPLSSLQAVFSAIMCCVEGAKRALYDFELDDIALDFGGGERCPFGFLSDGQRDMTALAADIALRCVQLNPHLEDEALKLTSGVVLIDELGRHLHPGWQRRVVGDLTSLFPKLQFVATTHSPFIFQSLDRMGLVNLSDGSVLEESMEPRGVEDIAEETMGVDMPQRSRLFRTSPTATQPHPTQAEFTEKQGQYLAFIHAYTKIHFRPPAEADMQRYFGVTPPTVHRMVLHLDHLRLIERIPGQARSIRVLVNADSLPKLK